MAWKNNREWTKEDTIELITVYEENSILWNTKSTEYRNREKKNKILQEIAVKFSCTSEEVQRKLHNLRNQVSQEIKKIRKKKSGDGTDNNYISNWPYFTALQFLVPVLTVNQTQSSMETTSSLHSSQLTEPISEVEAESEQQMPNEVAVSIDNPENVEKAEPQRKTKQTVTKRKHRDYEDDKLFKKALETFQKPPDADDRFGEYVAMELKGLRSEYNKRRLKSEIRRAVAHIVDEDDMYNYATSSSTPSPSPGFFVQPATESACTATALPSPTPQIQPSGEESTQSCREYVNLFQFTDL